MINPSPYREAVGEARHYWNLYRDLPRWRIFARRRALLAARLWAIVAIKAKASEN